MIKVKILAFLSGFCLLSTLVLLTAQNLQYTIWPNQLDRPDIDYSGLGTVFNIWFTVLAFAALWLWFYCSTRKD